MRLSDIPTIQSIFDQPLPGRSAHAVMARNLGRGDMIVPEDARSAAVMILLYPNKTGDLQVVFTERAVTDNRDTHSGQMSFPGGKMDPTDPSFEYTALRETWEEVGVEMNLVNVIGKLTELYIPVSNFKVYPFVGYLEQQPDFIKEEREVAEIITTSLDHLLQGCTEPLSIDIETWKGFTLKEVPYFDIKGKVLWGATSMMLNEFLVAIRERLS